MVKVRVSALVFLIIATWTLAGDAQADRADNTPTSALTGNSPYEGRRIDGINFVPARQPLEPEVIKQLLPLKIGAPFQTSDAREAIQKLYATGRYEDIVIDASPGGNPGTGGVLITITTRNSWFIGRVEIEGDIPEPPNAGQLITASRLDLGQPFEKDKVKAAADNMRRLLISNGFYNSQVDSDLEYNDLTQEVNLTFTVTARHRARFAPPVVKSDGQVLTDKQIIKASHWHWILIPKWQQLTLQRVTTGVEKIRVKYQNANRLLATVSLDSLEYSSQSNSVSPHLSVTAGPVVDVKADGAKISKKRIQTEVPIYEERAVDRDLLVEGQRNLRDYFQSEGYFDAKATFQEGRIANGKQEIDYQIELGTRHRLMAVAIGGNRFFDTRAIRERMLMQPKSFEMRRGRYSDAYLRRDRDAIAELYRSNGFRDVKVTGRAVDDYRGRLGDIAVFVNIDEGAQWLVGKLTITGQEKLDLSQVIPRLSSSSGQPFSEFNVAADRDTILARYFSNGFAGVTFEWNSTPAAEAHRMDLEFHINEGRQQFVREVLVEGLHTTKQKLVDEQLHISPGDPLSPIAMAETQRRLYDLGVFARVDAAVQNPDGDEDRKYVLYQAEEAHRYSITGGVGAEIARIGGSTAQADLTDPSGATGFSPRVSLDISRINAFGIGDTITLRSRLSTLQKRAALDYLVPRLFGSRDFDIDFSAIYDDSRDVRTFGAKREEVAVQITHRLTKPIILFYRYAFRNVTVNNLKIDPLLVPLYSETVHIGIFTVNLVQDRRDDPTDAHKGIYNSLEAGLADHAFGSRSDFGRLLGRNATYTPIGSKFTLARQTTFGFLPAFNIPPNADPTDAIPIAERFFGGGNLSHRGFPENQAGPRDLDTGFPLGGSAEFFNNTELRFPLIGENVNGVLFHDMGNVYSSIGQMSFRVSQRGLNDFNYMVHAVGFGVRYRTPVGPIRLDLAYSINPPRFNGFAGTFTDLVNCTATNSCTRATQQISHFQFFFSIGQAF
jgi:outer membrane protein insertion porin family